MAPISAFVKVQELSTTPEIQKLQKVLSVNITNDEHYAAAYNCCLILASFYGGTKYTKKECRKNIKTCREDKKCPFNEEETDRLLGLSMFTNIARTVRGKESSYTWPVGDEFNDLPRLRQLLKVVDICQDIANISDEAVTKESRILRPDSQAMKKANEVTREYMKEGSKQLCLSACITQNIEAPTLVPQDVEDVWQHAVFVIVDEDKKSGRASRKRIYSWKVENEIVTEATTCGFKKYASVNMASMAKQIEEADKIPIIKKPKGTEAKSLFRSRDSIIYKESDKIAICKVQRAEEFGNLITAENISQTGRKKPSEREPSELKVKLRKYKEEKRLARAPKTDVT